jgi:CMP-N-acetylneuraminic acid synthetase
MNKVAIVLTRSGSTRVKDKNSRMVDFRYRRSLLQIKLTSLISTDIFSRIISASNCSVCLDQSSALLGVHVYKRRSEYCNNNSGSIEALNEVIKSNYLNVSRVSLYQCTSPFLTESSIISFEDMAMSLNDKTILASVHLSKDDLWSVKGERLFKNEPRRQQDRSGFFIENSAMYSFPVINGKVYFDIENFKLFEIPQEEGFDVNTSYDFKIAKNTIIKGLSEL